MNALQVAVATHANIRNLERSGQVLSPVGALPEIRQRLAQLEEQVKALKAIVAGTVAEARKAEGGLMLADIKRAVCRSFAIPLVDLVSERRTIGVVLPRQVAMYLMRTLTTQSLPQIGRAMGGRDHTTVLHAVRKVAERRRKDEWLNGEIAALEAELAPREAPEPQQEPAA